MYWFIAFKYIKSWFTLLMSRARITAYAESDDNKAKVYHFYQKYYDVTKFYNNVRTFDTDNSYYGKTFKENTDNTYFVVVDKGSNPFLYNIPNREEFLKSLANYDNGKMILQIHFTDDSMIYVARDNSLRVNNVYGTRMELTDFDQFPFRKIPNGKGSGHLFAKKPKRERSETFYGNI